MEQRAVCLQKVPVTGGAVQLAPGAAAGMPVGTEIAPAHPAPIGAVWMRAEMPRGVHLARASSCGGHAGWWCAGGLRVRRGCLRTGLAVGLVREARKGFGARGCLRGGGR